MALMQDLNARGSTIVFVTHEPDIAAFSSRTIMLKDGVMQRDFINENRKSAQEALSQLPAADSY
jgi:putative ABC transport system ATP-binding protein